jgi:multiple antibiotic resistance protein
MSTWMEYARFPLTLFVILTPIAVIPVYMNLMNGQNRSVRARVVRITVLTVLVALGSAAIVGNAVLLLFGCSLDGLRVGGGIALLLIGLSKLSGSPDNRGAAATAGAGGRAQFGVVPLGIPLLAGPGAISTVIIHAQQGGGASHLGLTLAGIGVVCGLVWLMLTLAPAISQRLGTPGLRVVDRIVGLLLAAAAIELIAAGLRALFPGLA